jgi:fatty acid desaturase
MSVRRHSTLVQSLRTAPGPDADRAFRLGIVAASVLWVAGLTALYVSGLLSLPVAAYGLVVLLPIYLLVVAAALSVWLGFSKDATALERVHETQDSAGEFRRY